MHIYIGESRPTPSVSCAKTEGIQKRTPCQHTAVWPSTKKSIKPKQLSEWWVTSVLLSSSTTAEAPETAPPGRRSRTKHLLSPTRSRNRDPTWYRFNRGQGKKEEKHIPQKKRTKTNTKGCRLKHRNAAFVRAQAVKRVPDR